MSVTADVKTYQQHLKLDKEGTKINAIQLDNLKSADPVAIGKFLISKYRNWLPEAGTAGRAKLGSLYGFDLMIERHLGSFNFDKPASYYNTLYAMRAETGNKYLYNSGAPNADNPKLAARYYLNAIDKAESQVEKMGSQLKELESQIPQLENLLGKKFERESELQDMKTELTKLEREIAQNIKAKQELQQQGERKELIPADGEREYQEKPAEAKAVELLPAGSKIPVKVSIAQPQAYSSTLNEHAEQVLKKTKGVRL